MEYTQKPKLLITGFAQDPFFESGMLQNQTPISTQLFLQSRSTLPVNSFILNSRSLTLKHARRRGNRTHQCPDSVTSSSTQGILSLSHESLFSPAQRATFNMNYLPPFLPIDLIALAVRCPADTQRAPSRTSSPGFTSMSRQSFVHYDSLSKSAISSIQKRHKLEKKEKQPPSLSIHDMSVYDTPSGCSLPSRRSTPAAYGSREFLMSSAAYGLASLLQRASRTSSLSMHANVALKSRSLSPSACYSLEHHAQHSIPMTMPDAQLLIHSAESSGFTHYLREKRLRSLI